jgi:N-acyl-D-aspartate/D-glutamate deacylase
MPKESAKARCTQSEARATYISAAERLWETFIAWYDAHPDATFDEMEEVAGEQGRGLLGDVLALAVRRGDPNWSQGEIYILNAPKSAGFTLALV